MEAKVITEHLRKWAMILMIQEDKDEAISVLQNTCEELSVIINALRQAQSTKRGEDVS